MQEVFEKIIEKLEEQIRIEENIAKKESDGHPITHQYAACEEDERNAENLAGQMEITDFPEVMP